jgi:hypothetical protein
MESAPGHSDVDEVRNALLELPHVSDVHDLYVSTITTGFVALSAHVTCPGDHNHDRFCARPGRCSRDGSAFATQRFRSIATRPVTEQTILRSRRDPTKAEAFLPFAARSVCLTLCPSFSILREVRIVIRRLSAVIVAMGLLAGNAAVCAGWLATPEARMACCAEGNDCPMHKGDSQSAGSERVLTQAQADSCCASSERENSNQSNPSFATAITAAVLGVGMVLPASVPALVLSDAWRTSAPLPVEPVPKHVLLSVFLV